MRVLVFTLALVTSPVGAVVCEVVCEGHAAAGHIAAPVTEARAEGHHQHGDATPAAPAPGGTRVGRARAPEVLPCGMHSRVSDCAPSLSQPATLRTVVTLRLGGLTADPVDETIHFPGLERQRTGGPPVRPPLVPPLRSTIPLRI